MFRSPTLKLTREQHILLLILTHLHPSIPQFAFHHSQSSRLLIHWVSFQVQLLILLPQSLHLYTQQESYQVNIIPHPSFLWWCSPLIRLLSLRLCFHLTWGSRFHEPITLILLNLVYVLLRLVQLLLLLLLRNLLGCYSLLLDLSWNG